MPNSSGKASILPFYICRFNTSIFVVPRQITGKRTCIVSEYLDEEEVEAAYLYLWMIKYIARKCHPWS